MFNYLKKKNILAQAGRSMIEMLGVLAIIGVLSVGGIAGYSQAMTKYKVNRTIDEYMHLFRGLIEYEDSLKKLPGAEIDGAGPGIAEFIKASNLVPETWRKKSGDYYLVDSNGFNLRTLLSNKRYLLELYLEVHQKEGYATPLALFQVNYARQCLEMCLNRCREQCLMHGYEHPKEPPLNIMAKNSAIKTAGNV